MTIEEFENARFTAGMEVETGSAMFGTVRRPIVRLDFDQALIGITLRDEEIEDDDDERPIYWLHCEDCRLITDTHAKADR